MSDKKFTPGEWRAKGNSVRWKKRDPLCPDNLFNGLICKCVAPDDVPEAKEEVTANASLIAAAPKMYRMLDFLSFKLNNLSNYFYTNKKDDDGDYWKHYAIEIDKLLKKARGEE